MAFSVQIKGKKRLGRQLRRLTKRMETKLKAEVQAAGFFIANEAQTLLNAGPARSGRLYQRGTEFHRASAPGEPPKSDTGQLASSIDVVQDTAQSVLVGSFGVNYGRRLEEEMDRPWLSIVVEKNRKKVERIIQNAVDRMLRRV